MCWTWAWPTQSSGAVRGWLPCRRADGGREESIVNNKMRVPPLTTERGEAAERVCLEMHVINLCGLPEPERGQIRKLLDTWHLMVEHDNEKRDFVAEEAI